MTLAFSYNPVWFSTTLGLVCHGPGACRCSKTSWISYVSFSQTSIGFAPPRWRKWLIFLFSYRTDIHELWPQYLPSLSAYFPFPACVVDIFFYHSCSLGRSCKCRLLIMSCAALKVQYTYKVAPNSRQPESGQDCFLGDHGRLSLDKLEEPVPDLDAKARKQDQDQQ